MQCLIGNRHIRGNDGSNLVFDIVMLPEPEFKRMRMNVGVNHVVAPALKAGPAFQPGFVLADAKHVVVPTDESNPEEYARNYFLLAFGLIGPQPAGLPAQQPSDASYANVAEECTQNAIRR